MKRLCLNIAFSVLFMLTGQSVVSGGAMAQNPDPDFFIFLGIGEPLRQEAGGVCYSAIPWVDRIPEYFRQQSGKDIAYVASSEGLTGMDEYHFSSEGYRIIGKRYGDIMLPILMEQIVANTILIPADRSDDVIYDLLGRRLDAPQKGINIINGKKVIIR